MSAAEKPSLRFHYPKKLHGRVVAVLDSIDRAEDPTGSAEALGDVVVELTKAGMHAYFLDPINLVDLGPVFRRSSTLGVRGIVGMMSPLIRNAINNMDAGQLRKLSVFIRGLMPGRNP